MKRFLNNVARLKKKKKSEPGKFDRVTANEGIT